MSHSKVPRSKAIRGACHFFQEMQSFLPLGSFLQCRDHGAVADHILKVGTSMGRGGIALTWPNEKADDHNKQPQSIFQEHMHTSEFNMLQYIEKSSVGFLSSCWFSVGTVRLPGWWHRLYGWFPAHFNRYLDLNVSQRSMVGKWISEPIHFENIVMQQNAFKIPGPTDSQQNFLQFDLTAWSLKYFGILQILKLLQDSSTKDLHFPSSKTSKASGHWEHRELTVVAMLTASGEICINGISSTMDEREKFAPDSSRKLKLDFPKVLWLFVDKLVSR